LHPWPLFRQHELAPGEVLAGNRKEEGDLQRENEIPIHVLVQAIKIALSILKEERSRLGLTGLVASIKYSAWSNG
jgi:hypothetical protein